MVPLRELLYLGMDGMDAFYIITLHSKQKSSYWLSQLDDSKSIQVVCFTISIHRTLVCLEFQVNLLFARKTTLGAVVLGPLFRNKWQRFQGG